MNPCFYESVQILHDWIVPSEDHTKPPGWLWDGGQTNQPTICPLLIIRPIIIVRPNN